MIFPKNKKELLVFFDRFIFLTFGSSTKYKPQQISNTILSHSNLYRKKTQVNPFILSSCSRENSTKSLREQSVILVRICVMSGLVLMSLGFFNSLVILTPE